MEFIRVGSDDIRCDMIVGIKMRYSTVSAGSSMPVVVTVGGSEFYDNYYSPDGEAKRDQLIAQLRAIRSADHQMDSAGCNCRADS